MANTNISSTPKPILTPSIVLNYTNGQSFDITGLVTQFLIIKTSSDFTTLYVLDFTIPILQAQTNLFLQNVKNVTCKVPLYSFEGSLLTVFYGTLIPVYLKTSTMMRMPDSGTTSRSLEYQFVRLHCRPSGVVKLQSFISTTVQGTPINCIRQLLSPLKMGYISPSSLSTNLSLFIPNQRLIDGLYYVLDRGAYKSEVIFSYDIVDKQEQYFIYSTDDSINNVQYIVHIWDKNIPTDPKHVTALAAIPAQNAYSQSFELPQKSQQVTYTQTDIAQVSTQKAIVVQNAGSYIQPTYDLNQDSIISTNPVKVSNALTSAALRGSSLQLSLEGFPQLISLHPGQCIELQTANIPYKHYIGKYIVDSIYITVDLDKKSYNYIHLQVRRYGLKN